MPIMDQIVVKIPRRQLEFLDELVKRRYYPNRSEAVRIAIRDLVRNELFQKRFNAFPTMKEKRRKETLELLKHDPDVIEIVESIVKEISGR